MSKWRERIPIPVGINTKYGPARQSTIKSLMGTPTGEATTECQNSKVSAKTKPFIVTKDVGPFKLTGFGPFLDILTKVFAEYKEKFPAEYADLSTAGCLCVRLVRGSNHLLSNHCWGPAVDLGYGGVIDRRGDGLTYRGLLNLYSIAKKYKLYWGAGFATEDAMHFEASEQLLREWDKAGII